MQKSCQCARGAVKLQSDCVVVKKRKQQQDPVFWRWPCTSLWDLSQGLLSWVTVLCYRRDMCEPSGSVRTQPCVHIWCCFTHVLPLRKSDDKDLRKAVHLSPTETDLASLNEMYSLREKTTRWSLFITTTLIRMEVWGVRPSLFKLPVTCSVCPGPCFSELGTRAELAVIRKYRNVL